MPPYQLAADSIDDAVRGACRSCALHATSRGSIAASRYVIVQIRIAIRRIFRMSAQISGPRAQIDHG
jgi:hypothetical protein